MSVSADRRSESVPDARTRVRKRASDVEVVWEEDSVYAVTSCRRSEAARVDFEERYSGEGVGREEGDLRAGRARYHWDVGVTI
jgi:hypothetical protein